MMMLVPELDDMEAATVHVEVDIALLEIRGDGFPDEDLRMQCFNGLPSSLADAFAVAIRKDEQQFEIALCCLFVNLKHNAADLLLVQDNPVGFGVLSIDGILDSFSGDYLFPFLTTIIQHPELLLGAILERPLVVQDELLPVFGLQRNEYDFR